MPKQEKPVVAEIVQEEVEGKALDLFHDRNRPAYARILIDEHFEVSPVNSVEFAHWVRGTYYQATGLALKKGEVNEAINFAESVALFAGDQREVFIRVGHHDDRIYVDLGDRDWRAVEIDRRGWRVTKNPKAMLRRAPGTRSLPLPGTKGDVAQRRPFLNVNDDGFVLAVAFLVAALHPSGPYPILILQGEAGSGKSTFARIVSSLVDPTTTPLLGVPREPRDVMVAANSARLLSYDNLSGLSPRLADVLCRLATHASHRERRYYTNLEEIRIDASRPIMMNGIDHLAGRDDLQSRAIVLHLEPITEGNRRPESQLWRDFERVRPLIFSGLLDAVAASLRNIDQVDEDDLPRMADFFRRVIAAEPALPWYEGTFKKAYQTNRDAALTAALEGDLFALAVMDLLSTRRTFEGTASDLQTALGFRSGRRDWGKTPNEVGSRLKRAAPALRHAGVAIEHWRQAGTGKRLVRLELATVSGRGSSHSSHHAAEAADSVSV